MAELCRNMIALAAATAWALVLPVVAFAQHADVEFEYADGRIEIEFGSEGQVFEGNFPTSGQSEQFTDDPGFESEPSEGLGITPDHVIDYNILGPLEFHNGTSIAATPAGAQIQIDDNPSGSLTVTDSTVGPVSGPGAIGQAGPDEGGGLGAVHSHIDFTLQPGEFDEVNNPPSGAYALLMSLSSFEADGATPSGIADSDPFYIVFNFGLEEAVFEGAVQAFAAQIPEPSSLAIAAFGVVAFGIGIVGRGQRARRANVA